MDKLIIRCKSALACFFLFIFLFCAYSTAEAQVPRTINYQGILLSPDGNPVKDGMHVLKLSLYNGVTGGSPLYSESISAETRSGFFTVALGASAPLPAFLTFDRQYFLGVAIDGSDELGPRTAFTSSPYALHSQIADYANGLSSDVKGVVTSINEIAGPIDIIGDRDRKSV